MKTIITLFIASFITITSFAAETESNVKNNITDARFNNLTGSISDKLTGENLAGVEVHLLGTEEKTYTDFDGNFEFKNIEVGAHAIKVQFISYREIVENVYVDKQNKPLNIKLESIQK